MYRYSKGIPRLINTVCDNALIAAYAGKCSRLSEIIDEVAKDLRLNVTEPAGGGHAGSASDGAADIAKSLLQLVEALERVARTNPAPANAVRPRSQDRMSRVYEALRQSELDNGATSTLLDPDTFLTTTSPPAKDQPGTGLAWHEIRSLLPAVREESRVVTMTEGNSLGAEKFRLLRARLRNLRERGQLQKLVITSAVPSEGKTLVAMNLAVCLAKHTDEKILLLEGDLRKPMLGEHLGIKTLPGVGEWWASAEEPVDKFIYRFDDLQLWILPAARLRRIRSTFCNRHAFWNSTSS